MKTKHRKVLERRSIIDRRSGIDNRPDPTREALGEQRNGGDRRTFSKINSAYSDRATAPPISG